MKAHRTMNASEDAVCRHFNIMPHPGWEGMFTTREHEGAMRNGARVRKVQGDASDGHALGDRATVLGSFGIPGRVAYFVEWDDMPKCAVLVVAEKLAPLDPQAVALDIRTPDNPGGGRRGSGP